MTASISTRALGMAAFLALALATPAPAVEVRRGAEPLYAADMRQAYAPCLVPNAVTDAGQPACFPALRSVCRISSGHVEMTGGTVTLDVRRPLATQPLECTEGFYHFEVTFRSTFEQDPTEPRCGTGVCTQTDETLTFFPFQLFNLTTHAEFGLFIASGRNTNFQIRSVTLIGPDGLPVAAASAFHSGVDPTTATQNLSVGYEACVEPAPGFDSCDAAWDSPCDFGSGTITTRTSGVPSFTATLHQIAGSSPLCTAGTYLVEARVRATLDACGPEDGSRLCTLPDKTFVMPLAVSGPEFTNTIGFNPGGLNATVAAELLGFRVFDPTGALFAAASTTTATDLGAPAITMKEDRLQLRATFPPDDFDQIDPAEDEGVTVSLHDKNGGIYAVTIPGPVWQLQPPIGERWELRDPGGALNGVRKARVKLLRRRGIPVGYDVRLEAGGVDLSAADLASVTLRLGIARRKPPVIDGLKEAESNRACRIRGGKKQCR